MKEKIGFVGLGEMGKWMAINIAKSGFPLIVYDIRPETMMVLVENGALPASNLGEVAHNSSCIFLSLPDAQIVEKVIMGENGLVNALSIGSIVVDLSTTHYSATLKIEEVLRSMGAIFLDAPVSGMESRAKDATLTVMVGGRSEALEKIRPILNAIANNIVYTGKSGNGQLTKLINQLFFNISVAAMAELLPMAVKLGLDPEAVFRVVMNGTGRTYALEFFAPYILENDFRTGYPLDKAYKDMISTVEISSSERIPLPVFWGAMQTYQMALAQGLGNESKGAMIKVWEKVLGVEVRRRKSCH